MFDPTIHVLTVIGCFILASIHTVDASNYILVGDGEKRDYFNASSINVCVCTYVAVMCLCTYCILLLKIASNSYVPNAVESHYNESQGTPRILHYIRNSL